VLLLLCCGLLHAEVTLVAEQDLFPRERHRQISSAILQVIDDLHYKGVALDDQLSQQLMDNYLRALDPNRVFFTLDDVNEVTRDRFLFDDALNRGDLQPAYRIYRTYRERVADRIAYALSLLQGEFDFTLDEEFVPDRRELPWAVTREELDEVWRKRVKNDMLRLLLADKAEIEARELLQKRYRNIQRNTFQLDADDVFQAFINAFTTSIEPHTSYLSPHTSENFDINMRLSLEGIGAVLVSDGDEMVSVQRLVPGGPAEMQGELEAGDFIVGVGQGRGGSMVDVIGWRLQDVVELIRGPKGSVVRLDVLPAEAGLGGPTRIVAITRDKVRLEQRAAKALTMVSAATGARIGIIDLPSFYVDFAAQTRGDEDYRSTTRDVHRLLLELQQGEGVDGIILDLRDNGGGSLSEALGLTGLFIETGPIVQTRNARGRIEISRDDDPYVAYPGPLAVLVNRGSASASEIFAGAIQDYQRGIIIGEPTFGKGTVQNVVDLNRFSSNPNEDYGRLKTTIAQFFRVSGGSNQYRGVLPDIAFPMEGIPYDEFGERSLPGALPYDRIAPASYAKASAPIYLYEQVRERHRQRLQTDPDLILLRRENDYARRNYERRAISLLEEKRRREQEEFLALEQERKERQQGGLDDESQWPEVASPEQLDVFLREASKVLEELIIDPQEQRTAGSS